MFFCGKRGFIRLMLGLAAVWLSAAGAAAAEDRAVAFLNGLKTEVVTEVAAPRLTDSQRHQNFRAILRRVFSMDDICQMVLGRYGRSATAEERQEFRQLFEDTLVLTWTRRFRDYTGQGIRFGAVAVANDDVLVQSEVEGTDHRMLAVEWRLREDAGTYRLLDIKAEGASMVLTYRSEYQSILRNGGMAMLNGQLRKRIEELGTPG